MLLAAAGCSLLLLGWLLLEAPECC
jgi:hypothetical protein